MIGRLLLIAALLAGCNRSPLPAAEAAAPTVASAPVSAVSAPAKPALAIDPRDQRALALAIRGGDPAKVRREFVGKRYRWSLRFVAPFCRTAERCHLVAFERKGADGDLLQGWLPRLDLTEKQHAALTTRCAGAPRCRVTVEGTLNALILSRDDLTQVTLNDVRVLDQ